MCYRGGLWLLYNGFSCIIAMNSRGWRPSCLDILPPFRCCIFPAHVLYFINKKKSRKGHLSGANLDNWSTSFWFLPSFLTLQIVGSWFASKPSLPCQRASLTGSGLRWQVSAGPHTSGSPCGIGCCCPEPLPTSSVSLLWNFHTNAPAFGKLSSYLLWIPLGRWVSLPFMCFSSSISEIILPCEFFQMVPNIWIHNNGSVLKSGST